MIDVNKEKNLSIDPVKYRVDCYKIFQTKLQTLEKVIEPYICSSEEKVEKFKLTNLEVRRTNRHTGERGKIPENRK